MSDTKTLCDITNSTFRFNISVELFETRDKFCPMKGSIKCANDCPIYREYYSRGFSCSGALDKYPDECKKLMAGSKPFSAAGTPVLREAYARIGIECIDKTPVEFFEYNEFWASHSDDNGFDLLYLDADNKIVQ